MISQEKETATDQKKTGIFRTFTPKLSDMRHTSERPAENAGLRSISLEDVAASLVADVRLTSAGH